MDQYINLSTEYWSNKHWDLPGKKGTHGPGNNSLLFAYFENICHLNPKYVIKLAKY